LLSTEVELRFWAEDYRKRSLEDQTVGAKQRAWEKWYELATMADQLHSLADDLVHMDGAAQRAWMRVKA
jgi:hypothetical protein